MKITAIILNYKNYLDTKECILSLQNQSLSVDYTLNLLIIDNASGDGSTQKLQAEFPQHSYIFNDDNLGFAKGVNQGIKLTQSDSDYFLLINNDAKLAQNCLASLIKESDGKAITGPAIYYKKEPNIIWQGGGYFSKLRMNIIVPDKNQPKHNSYPLIVDFLSGCVLLIPKSVIEVIKGFDEDFFFYGEDLDFCLRAKENNIAVKYCPNLSASHNIERAAISRTNPFVLENLAFGFILIIRKHFKRQAFYGLILFFFIYAPFRAYQIIIGGGKLRNIYFWIKGGLRASKKII